MLHPKSYKSGYPRPQFVRGSFKSLNGKWFFIDGGDPDNIFLSESSITVPFAPECAASGIGKRESEKYVTYGRYVNLIKNDRSKRIFLHFEGVDYSAELFVNGRYVSKHSGAFTRWSAEVTDVAVNGINKIVLRVYDTTGDGQVRGDQKPGGAGRYAPYSGIWKSVWTETVGRYCIRSISAQTRGDLLAVDVVTDCPHKFVIAAELRRGGERVVKKAVSAGNCARIVLQMPSAVGWSCANPVLYDLRLALAVDKKIEDSVLSYVGFRDISVRDGMIAVGGKPEFLGTVLYSGCWENTGSTPPDEAAICRDVELIKSMGFNCVLMHGKIGDERFLYYCDVLGLNVLCEMPSVSELTAVAKRRYVSEWTRIIELNRSHPCIIAWLPYAVADGANAAERAFADEVSALTRSLDSRPTVCDGNADSPKLADVECVIAPCGTASDIEDARLRLEKSLDSAVGDIKRGDGVCGWRYSQFADARRGDGGLLQADRSPKIPIDAVRQAVVKDRGL